MEQGQLLDYVILKGKIKMNNIQNNLLPMFKWFHSFCSENKLTYYALGGTALGAVRHSGFIPWDDDIDVGMPRPCYEKLVNFLKKENKFGKYIIEYPLEHKDSMYPFLKLYDTSTTLTECVKNYPRRGIYIDIFPLDGIGNTKKESLNNYKKINFWINLLNTKICVPRKERCFLKNIAIVLSSLLPNCICGKDILIKKINDMGKSNDYEENDYVVNLFGAWKEREITKKEWFGTPKLCSFENTCIYIPQNADKYLSALYGNYMELPPAEKQISHHYNIELNLKKSYLEE